MVRHVDTVVIGMKERSLDSQILQIGGMAHLRGHMGRHQDWSGGRRGRGYTVAQSLYLEFQGKEGARQGR